MKKNRINEIYDVILLGSSPVFLIEAIYQKRSGNKVLIIDQNPSIGGAWAYINIDGISHIENAIHYLWNNSKCTNFLNDKLNIPITKRESKYRIIMKYGFLFKLRYDSIFSKFFAIIFRKKINIKDKIYFFIKSLKKGQSIYFKNGSPQFIDKLTQIAKEEDIKISLNTKLTNICLGHPDYIELSISNNIIYTKKLFVSHGSFIPIIKLSSNNIFSLNEKSKPRPAFHLIVNDFTPKMSECIFENDDLIKYVHDITKYSSLKNNDYYGNKILVFALKQSITYSKNLSSILICKLQRIGMLSKHTVLLNEFWQDIRLPPLDDIDLDLINSTFPNRLIAFKTDTLSISIADNASRWSTVF